MQAMNVVVRAARAAETAAGQPSKALTTQKMSPIREVVTLLGEMEAQVEKKQLRQYSQKCKKTCAY
jgi:hypothetical protein